MIPAKTMWEILVMPKPYLRYLQGHPGETWQQALDRLAKLCANLHEFVDAGEVYEVFFDDYYRDGALLEWHKPVPEPALERVQVKHGLTMPLELKELFRHSFAIYRIDADLGRQGDRRLLDINAASGASECLHPFCQAIEWHFGRWFVEEELSPEQVRQLDSRYFGFGRWTNDDRQSSYLLLDRHGGFGIYEFNTGDYPANMQRLGSLLAGERLRMSLDDVLVWAINQSIMDLLTRNDVPTTAQA